MRFLRQHEKVELMETLSSRCTKDEDSKTQINLMHTKSLGDGQDARRSERPEDRERYRQSEQLTVVVILEAT